MDLFDAISQRYSYRGAYKQEPVPRGDLRKIMEAGLAAPSGCNKQTTSLVGVDDETMLNNIWAALGRLNEDWWQSPQPSRRNAKAAVVVLTQKLIGHGSTTYYMQDYAAAIENMLLSITALGYASCWIEGEVTSDPRKQAKLAELLKVPEGYHVVAVLPVGVAEAAGKRPRYKPFDERAWFI